MLIKNDYKPRMLPTQPPSIKPVTTDGRIKLVLVVVLLAFAGLLARGIYLQVGQHEFLKEQGDMRVMRTLPLPASRGTITDRNGLVLAISSPVDSLYAMPKYAVDKQGQHIAPTAEQLNKLSVLLGVPVETLREKLNDKNKAFVYLKRQLPLEVSQQIAKLHIPGLAFQREHKRHYPMGNVFAHVLGFTNIDGVGQEGLELSRESYLHGKAGAQVVLRDNKGNIVEALKSPRNQLAVDGHDMVLSLDQRIQSTAYESLNKAVTFHQAKAGSVVVLDAKTGELLALVNLPTYDSNHPAVNNPDARRNRAVTDMIEPGSAMKPFAIAKGLDAGKISPTTRFNTMPYKINGSRVRDTHDYPMLDVRGIIQKSSNVGTSKISALFSPQEMYGMYRSAGFGQRMHSGFPGESAGLVRDWHNWRPFEQATMSFGYGIQVSLLQLARAYTIFTNDGRLLPVSFLKLDKKPQGQAVVKPETAKMIRHMMIAVTEPGGTGTRGAVAGFDVAAKTGTAQKLVDGHYSSSKHMGTFIGFAPADNPRVIVAVNIDEPTANGYYAGIVAGPVFQEVMSNTLNILGISPTKPLKKSI